MPVRLCTGGMPGAEGAGCRHMFMSLSHTVPADVDSRSEHLCLLVPSRSRPVLRGLCRPIKISELWHMWCPVLKRMGLLRATMRRPVVGCELRKLHQQLPDPEQALLQEAYATQGLG